SRYKRRGDITSHFKIQSACGQHLYVTNVFRCRHNSPATYIRDVCRRGKRIERRLNGYGFLRSQDYLIFWKKTREAGNNTEEPGVPASTATTPQAERPAASLFALLGLDAFRGLISGADRGSCDYTRRANRRG